MLSAIGETMEAGSTPAGAPELITGVIMSARPQFYRIAIWTRQAEDPVEEAEAGSVGNRLLEVGKHLKTSILGYDLHQKIGSGGLTSEVEFQSHKESEKKKGKKFVAVSRVEEWERCA
jgi:translation initiation factor 4E